MDTQRLPAPEVLAPAGAPECLPAAVAGGATAVYLGLRHFNARGRAENFRTAELARHVAYLHHHGLKCYVVLNTLIHDDEHPKALLLAAAAQTAQVDAVIVQDLGLWQALARDFPRLKRHASTQMTVHHASQIEELARLGAERVILARELSLAEIGACTRAAHAVGVQTEIFVHGALCYSFSGQCLISNFAGCRSANRGTCAQNCRFDYERSLSMKDLSLAHRLGELAAAGVSSLKIEGRLKGPEYVYTVSRVYRAAVDAWREGRTFDQAWAQDLLKDVFSRPQTDAPLQGVYGEESRLHRFAPGQDRSPDATIVAGDARQGEVVVDCRQAVTPGQGFAFTVGRWNGGFLVLAATAEGSGRWRLRVRSGMRIPPLPVGTALFRNADHERKREAAAAMAKVPIAAVPSPTLGLHLTISGEPGLPLTVQARDDHGHSVAVVGSVPLAPAAKAPLDEALVRDKLGAFGGTAYHLDQLDMRIPSGLFVPAGELKALRRQVVTALDEATAIPVPEVALTESSISDEVPALFSLRRPTALWVAVGSLAAARAALEAGADVAWLDDAGLDMWGSQAPHLDLTGISAGRLWLRHSPVAATSPHLAALGLPVVAGHLGVLAAARAAGLPVTMDHYGNTFGWFTAQAYAQLGAHAVVLSLECSSREVARLVQRRNGDTPLIALAVHGRLPAMLSRQDHGLKSGEVLTLHATPADGGLPYEIQSRHQGAGGADTVVWEGRRLCAPEATLATKGLIDAWLLELADQSPSAVTELVAAYRDLRQGILLPTALTRIAERHAPLGIFPGHLLRGSRELDAMEGDFFSLTEHGKEVVGCGS